MTSFASKLLVLLLVLTVLVTPSGGCAFIRRLDLLNSQLEETNRQLRVLHDIDEKLVGTNERLERVAEKDQLAQANEQLAQLAETNRRLAEVTEKLSEIDKKLEKLDAVDKKLAPVSDLIKRVRNGDE